MSQLSQSFESVGFTDKSFSFGITAVTPISITIPGLNQQTYRASISIPNSASVWVGLNVSPTLPTEGSSASQPNVCLNPKFRFVRAGDVLYFNSTAAVADCGLELFELGS